MTTDDVLDRLQRLRSLGVRKGAQDLARPAPARRAGEGGPIPGVEVETPFGPAWLRVERYPLAQYGALAQLLEAPPAVLAAAGRDPALAALQPAAAALIDTETTGLSTGTGTYTFLIGVGTYERAGTVEPGAGEVPDTFVVRQFFMRNPAEERAQLHLVEQSLSRVGGIISFNGRAFDMPLINSRFTLAGAFPPPLTGAPHLDLLPAARRIWRARLSSCALSELERSVLGMQRTADDVPGWMIPAIYRDYYRSGQGSELMARVFYHNLTDIVSMAVLGGQVAELFQTAHLQQHLAELHPLDCLSLARCYDALEWIEAGEAAYRAALAAAAADAERALIFRELSRMLKRLERRVEAAALWEEWISTVAGDEDLTPYVELAKYHEWHTGDLAAARGWTAWAVHTAERRRNTEELDQLRRRLARIERKLAGQASTSPKHGSEQEAVAG